MATWNLFSISASQTGQADTGPDPVTRYSFVIDLNTVGGFGFGDTFASGDVIQLATLPIGATVLSAGMNVVAAGSGSGTFALGDTGSSTRYNAATAVATPGYTISTTPHAYTAADTLEVTVGTASVTTGVYQFWAYVLNPVNIREPALPGKI